MIMKAVPQKALNSNRTKNKILSKLGIVGNFFNIKVLTKTKQNF